MDGYRYGKIEIRYDHICGNSPNNIILLWLFFILTELELGTQSVVEMDDYQTILQSPSSIDKIDR